MEIKQAIETLAQHNEWRLGSDLVGPTDPKELTAAINKAIAVMMNYIDIKGRFEE